MSARWIEPEGGARRRAMRSPSSSTSASARQRSRAVPSSSRICSSSSGWPFRSSAGVQREAEHADRVGLARPEERRRHREVLVDARERHRLRERVRRRVGSRAARAAARRRRSGSPLPASMVAQLRPRRTRPGARCAARSGATPAAGRTGSPRRRATCSGETWRKKSSRSIGLQTEVSKKTPAGRRSARRGAARSAMPAWAMISCASG